MARRDPEDVDASSGPELDRVRGELRRLGYLDHSVERFLLQDAMRPARPLRTVLLLSAKVGLLGGLLTALAGALVLAAANGLLRTSPFDVVPLFFHLVPPMVLGVGTVFLLVAGLLALVLHVSHTRRIEAVSFAGAVVATLSAAAVALATGRTLLATLATWQLVALAALTLALMVTLVRVVQGGLLSLAIRLIDRPPKRRAGRVVGWVTAALGALLLLILPAVLEIRQTTPMTPVSLPILPAARVALIGVDGVRPGDLEFLLAGGELPHLAGLLDRGGVLLAYDRPRVPPASLWTTLATGLADPYHGMVSLDGYRPLGLTGSLTRSGPLRVYFATVGRVLGLVEHRPILAHQRRAPVFWELAARGGRPILAVDWWGTFPAADLPGLVVAHGAYQLLGESAAGAVAPATAGDDLRALRAGLDPGPIAAGLRAALPAEEAAEVLAKAVLPDAFYAAVFRHAVTPATRAAALYLPGLDIAAELTEVGDVVAGELVRWQLTSVDRLAGETLGDVDVLVVAFDPGRRAAGEGRVLLWRRAGCAGPATKIAPGAVAAALLRGLGLPQSRELPAPPAVCAWPAPSLTIDSFGPRAGAENVAADDEEYLRNLRALGYL